MNKAGMVQEASYVAIGIAAVDTHALLTPADFAVVCERTSVELHVILPVLQQHLIKTD